MAVVRILSDQPETPSAAQTATLVPLRAQTLGRLAEGVTHCCTWRTHRAAHCVYDYDTTASGIVDQTPTFVDETLYAYWTASPRAKHVWVHLVLQAAENKGSAAPALTISLETAPGGVIDPGMSVPLAALLVEDANLATSWAPFTIRTPPRRIVPAPLAPSGPRLLNVGNHQGQLLAVALACQSVRVLSVDIWEWVPAHAPQTFA